MHHNTDPALLDCIEKCWTCRDTCQSVLFNYCLEKGGKHAEADHVRLMVDCIQICQTSGDFMTRNSRMHASVCTTCAAICEACARSCDAVGDAEMRRCAEACRACAKSCWEVGRRAGLMA
ncbi:MULTISPECIES: four-helix bundle copper-binding protein [Rhodomicrobium]|uniref:four-helix bundle copper-binding protein n=1 Tax=Rhodomicrobium TaxID=1068 RepID=UPI000BA5B18C|nr:MULTISPECIES: four-helix bundle copper-binding protein [Rhodomicrobium]